MNDLNLPHVSDQKEAEHHVFGKWLCDLMTSITVCQGMPRQRSFDVGRYWTLKKGGHGHVFDGPDWEDCHHHSFPPPTVYLIDLTRLNIILTSHDDGTRQDLVPRNQLSSQEESKKDIDRDNVCPDVCDGDCSCSIPDGHSNCIG